MRVQDLKNTPKDLWDRTGATLPLKQVPAGMAIDLMGMGTWRLRGRDIRCTRTPSGELLHVM